MDSMLPYATNDQQVLLGCRMSRTLNDLDAQHSTRGGGRIDFSKTGMDFCSGIAMNRESNLNRIIRYRKIRTPKGQ